MPEPAPIAIIGAGLAGLACARRLADHGRAVVVFDKGRGIGGRLATRRVSMPDGASLAFDHGAQYVKARTDGFRAYLDALRGSGAAAVWSPRRTDTGFGDGIDWQVGLPGMSALAKPLAAGLDVRSRQEVAAIEGTPGAWRLVMADGEAHGPFARLVVTAPAPQTVRLLSALDRDLHPGDFSQVEMLPCWALLIAFDRPLAVPFDALRPRNDDQPLSWAARDTSKPRQTGGPATPECWVAHADGAWSRENLERTKEAIAPILSDAFRAVIAQATGTGIELGDPAYMAAHRWRYALASEPYGAPYAANTNHSILVAGDWLIAGRAEAAFESGTAAAAALLAAA